MLLIANVSIVLASVEKRMNIYEDEFQRDVIGSASTVKDSNQHSTLSEAEVSSFIEDSIVCSKPTITVNDEYCSILLDEATSYLRNPGQPILPCIVKIYTFPIGTTISEISCSSVSVDDLTIKSEISYASNPVPCGSSCLLTETEKDASIYESGDFYPNNEYEYNIGVGLDGNKRVTYLTVRMYPVRYSPAQNLIQYAEGMDIKIQQQPPQNPVVFTDAYDLLIIAPTSFEGELQRLVEHKEAMGIRTNLMTTEDIYGTYEGRDEQEKIKYCIKNAIENWNITYVMLFGGMKGQRFWSWYVPVRYSHVQPNLGGDLGLRKPFVSDLYYADVYKYDDETGFSFEDWDADGDGIFSEWIGVSNKDVMDLYPDVYIGRLPCRYKWNVATIVDRIITYETTTYGQDWFRRIAVAGGDTYLESSYGYSTDFDEGKEMTAYALNFMPDFEPIRLWTDGDGDIEYTHDNIMDVLNQGQGFFLYSGHGSPTSFATHPHGDDSIWIGIDTSDVKNLNNREKLPIYVLSNCDNCQFNVSLLNVIKLFTGGFEDPFLRMEIAPYCFGWLSSYLENGGAIAALGVTTIGLNDIGDSDKNGICDISEVFDGWIHAHYFYLYNQSIDILGNIHGQTTSDYLNQFPINWKTFPNSESHHNIPVLQYNALLGDPTLKIGGYPQ